MCNYGIDPELFSEVKETIISKEKWLNALINSMLYCCHMETVAEFVPDHGVAITPPKIDEAEQTAEGLSKFMYDEEKFDNW